MIDFHTNKKGCQESPRQPQKVSNAKKVKELLIKGFVTKQIAEKLNINKDFVANINNNNHFSYVEVEGWDEYRAKRKAWNEKINLYKEIAFKILELIDNGYKTKPIAEILDFPYHTIKGKEEQKDMNNL